MHDTPFRQCRKTRVRDRRRLDRLPDGAYIPDPSLTGKANFGFVSTYKKGAAIPTGRFMIWTRDDSPDTFRIKICWENGGENVVYDNGFSQPIGGGSMA